MSQGRHLDADREPTGPRNSAPSSPTSACSATAHCADPRARVIDALIATVSYRGYDRTTIERVIQTAEIQAAIFDEHFQNKEDCFLQALDELIGRLQRQVLGQLSAGVPWAERVRLGLGALLQGLAADHEGARVMMVECLSAGPIAVARHRSTFSVLVPLLEEGRLQAAHPEYLPSQTSEAVVGGIASIVHRRVLEERTAELPKLQADMAYFALVPYIGHLRAMAGAQLRPQMT
jgi:AcrR family transcriptional regulator